MPQALAHIGSGDGWTHGQVTILGIYPPSRMLLGVPTTERR